MGRLNTEKQDKMHNISYFFLPEECPDIGFLPHRAWESHALLPVGTAHPSSDFIHCNEVSGTEGQHTRKATSDPQLVLLAITGVASSSRNSTARSSSWAHLPCQEIGV